MADNLIIFGAGASFGSEPDDSRVPVTMQYLFEKMCELHNSEGSNWTYIRDHFPGLADRRYPDVRFGDDTPEEWSRKMRELPSLFTQDFENAFEWLRLYHPEIAKRLLMDLARYFIAFEPTTSSLYRALLRRCTNRWSGAIATLNYDVLAQRAAAEVQVDLNCDGTQPSINGNSRAKVELCLPHGSSSLFTSVFGDNVFSHFSQIPAGRPLVIIDYNKWMQKTKNHFLPPIMAHITSAKDSDVGSEFLEAQKQRFKELVGNAKQIVIIGLNVHTCDSHTWGPLANSVARIMYCSGKSAAERFRHWSEEHGRHSDVALDGDFVENFEDICRHIGLGSG